MGTNTERVHAPQKLLYSLYDASGTLNVTFVTVKVVGYGKLSYTFRLMVRELYNHPN